MRRNSPGAPEQLYLFVCEDGCGATVPFTIDEYDAKGGAWLDGHRPE